jgi:predicted RNA-binding Zn-ribbon protein involved in translation (DUF1610 family)
MINVCKDLVMELTQFVCPNCGANDTAYIRQPDYCYRCGELYKFDIDALMSCEASRLVYHFGKRYMAISGRVVT